MTRLRAILQERNETLLRDVEHQVKLVTPNLWHTYGTFPSGTKHTPEHTQMVEKIAGWLLGDELLRELFEDEIAFLILACHFHDLGMAGTEEDILTADGREQVRVEHAVSIGTRIVENWNVFGFLNETAAEILAEICKGHRPKRVEGEASWDDLSKNRLIGPDRDVRVRLVSAIVYAADELHIGEDRAPLREEEFNKIVNIESRRHWRRHQTVQGPVLRDGKLCFDGNVPTPMVEKELRIALRKAFQSVVDMTAQLRKSGIAAQPVGIRFLWNRKNIWELMIAKVCSDLVPRTLVKIEEEVEVLYSSQTEKVEDLSTFCEEDVNAESVQAEIQASISNFTTQAILIKSENDSYALGEKPKVMNYIFEIAKKADDEDRIFMDQDSPQHEYQLHLSNFGRRCSREISYPQIHQDYHINIAEMHNVKHFKTIFESSPTASRIVELIQPPPGVLVHTDLLEFASIAGTCADLINNPELILNAGYRHAITELFEAGAERLPKFLLFIKELAIIKKLSYQQISDALTPSEDEKLFLTNESDVSIQITQKSPKSRPDWSIGYLMLARLRAEVTITIQNSEAAPFQLTRSDGEIINEDVDFETPIALTLGPGQPMKAKTSSFRSRIELNSENSQLSIEAFKLSSDDSGKPLLFQFSPKEGECRAECQFRLVVPELTVGDVVTLNIANSIYAQGKLTTILKIEGNLLSSEENKNIPEIISEFYNSLVNSLATLDPKIPYPFFLEEMYEERLMKCDETTLQKEFDSVVAEIASNRITITTIFMRFSTVDSEDYYEEFLGMQPPNFGFNAPHVVCDSMSQEEIEERWKSGNEVFKLEMSLREDIYESAQLLREWIKDFSQPFPFEYGGENLHFHYSKTRFSITFERIRDRLWYLERRVTIRFRPVTKSERYGIEMNYWKSEGDEERACLLNELFQKAASEEAKAKSEAVSALELKQNTKTD